MLCWAAAATFSTAYFSYQYNDLVNRTRGTVIHVNLLIDYGNGTATWHNGTEATGGMTLLNVSSLTSDVNYTMWPGMGALVNGIDGVENFNPVYWMWWMWNSYSGWIEGPVGADKYVVSDGEVLCWYYENTAISPLPKP
jgi:hypothetical protein